MRIAPLTLVVALVAGSASAADWTRVAAGRARQVEIDRASILQSDPGTKVAWGRIVMKDDEVAAAGYKSVKALNRYDCRSGSFSTIKRVYLDPDQVVIREERVVDPKVIRVVEGSVDDRLFREVCNPPGPTQLAEFAARAEQAAAETRPVVPQIAPQIVTPLTEAEKRAAAAAREAALEHLGNRPGAHAALAPAAAPPAPVRVAVANQAPAMRATPAQRVSPRKSAAEPAFAVPPGTAWAYQGIGGPDNWARIRPEFALCGNGTRQSPIDVRDGIQVDLAPIVFDYRPTYFRIEDNGHTVQVSVGEGSSIRVMGRRFDLVQFHFHRPSEFRIDGRGFDMEVHLVHRDLDGRLAVVAVMLERGGALPIMQTLWNNLPLERHDSYAPDVAIDPSELLPEDHRYATFMGSLTTPPCSEGVMWMVMRQPMQVSGDQIAIFSRLHPMNARPLQQVAGRLIKQSR